MGFIWAKFSGWDARAFFARLEAPLKAGDGIVFDAGRPDEPEAGGRVTALSNGTEIRLYGDVDFSRIHAGDKIWKTSDPELDRNLRQTFAGETPRFRRALDLEIHGHIGRADDCDRAV